MRTKAQRLTILSVVASLALAGGAQARGGADDPVTQVKGHADDTVLLRQGADDPAGHNLGDDRVVLRKRSHRHSHKRHTARRHARRGADDPAGHR